MIFEILNGWKHFYQWDIGQKIIVKDDRVDELHFSNDVSNSSYPVEILNENGYRVANVPDFLLIDSGDLYVYAWVADDVSGHTLIKTKFSIYPKERPKDYVDPIEQKKWSELETKIGDLNDLSTEDKNNLVSAINEIADKDGTAGDSNPTKYKSESPTMLKKGLCCGDSLTMGLFDEIGHTDPSRAFPKLLSELIDVQITPLGQSGWSISDWWNFVDRSGTSFGGKGDNFAIIFLGIVDALNDGWTVNAETNLKNIIDKFRTDVPKIKLFLVTPPAIFDLQNFDDVANGIRSVAEETSCYLIDLREYWTECSPENWQDYQYLQGGHFNANGHMRLAIALKSYLGYIIDNNVNDFKNLEVLGTVTDPIDKLNGELIKTANINANGHLIITRNNNATIDCGLAKGADGTNGTDGTDGTNGADGFSPTVAVTEITGGHNVTITDKNGTQSFDVINGTNGIDGLDGVTFTPSISPAGVLSWENDGGKQNPQPIDLVQAVIDALPNGDEVSY